MLKLLQENCNFSPRSRRFKKHARMHYAMCRNGEGYNGIKQMLIEVSMEPSSAEIQRQYSKTNCEVEVEVTVEQKVCSNIEVQNETIDGHGYC